MHNKWIINNNYSGIEKTEHTMKAKISFLLDLHSYPVFSKTRNALLLNKIQQ